jgi:hypothetical protein
MKPLGRSRKCKDMRTSIEAWRQRVQSAISRGRDEEAAGQCLTLQKVDENGNACSPALIS